MKTESSSISFGNQKIAYSIIRRERKTLEISVEPDTTVVVVAPINASCEAIANKVHKHATWVLKQKRHFSKYLPRIPERQYVAGETHLYLGRQYRLKVKPSGDDRVVLTRGFITVHSRHPDDPEVTRRIVENWYFERAQEKFTERLELSLLRFPDPERFRPTGIAVRRIKHRWGSMSTSFRLILNRKLIESSVDAIDYVITHELCHIAEPNHGRAFYRLLDRVMPDWGDRKERLERSVV